MTSHFPTLERGLLKFGDLRSSIIAAAMIAALCFLSAAAELNPASETVCNPGSHPSRCLSAAPPSTWKLSPAISDCRELGYWTGFSDRHAQLPSTTQDSRFER